MPAPQTFDDLLEVCRKSGVVDMPRLEQFARTNSLPSDLRQAAAVLIQNGLLTRFQAAQLLQGKYRGFILNGLKILEQIGVGGMGAVYLCEQVTLRRRVAVKILPTKLAQDRVARERFFREARAVAALDHPNIVRIHDCASHDDVNYILMELVSGIDLQRRLEKDGPIPVDEAIGYIIQSASGLQHAHERGLVHRDIKPSNLLVDVHGTVKILDLGLARFFQDREDQLTEQLDGGAVIGTVDYLAPEQAIESSSVDARADIYSLGATLYTLLQGKPPFGGTTSQKLLKHQVTVPPPLMEARAEVPPELNRIVQKMMAKNPDDRFQTAAEVVEALTPWAPAPTLSSGITSVQAPRSSIIPRSMSEILPNHMRVPNPALPNKTRWNPKLFVGVGIGLLAILAAVVIFGGPKKEEVPPQSENQQAKADPRDVDLRKNNPPKVESPKKSNPPKKIDLDPVENHIPIPAGLPVNSKLLAELNLGNLEPVSIRFKRSQEAERIGTGNLPEAWGYRGWDKDSLVEFALEKIDNRPALVQRNLSGKPCSMLFSPSINFQTNCRYSVTLEYRTTGEARGKMVIQDDSMKAREVGDLPSTKGEWKSRRMSVEGFVSGLQNGRFEFHHTISGANMSLAYRKIQIHEIPLTEFPEQPIYSLDFATVDKFSARYQQYARLAGVGKLPEHWAMNCFRPGAIGEAGIEEVVGVPMLAIRSLEGEPSMQLFANDLFRKFDAGKSYRLRIRYVAETKCQGEFQLRVRVDNDINFPGFALRNTEGLLKTIEIGFSPVLDRQYILCVQNLAAGEKSTLFLKSIEILESTTREGANLARLDSAKMMPFQVTVKDHEEILREGSGALPTPWKASTNRPNSTGKVSLEQLGEAPILTLENLEGPPLIQVSTARSVCSLQAGHRYELRVRYSTETNRNCHVSIMGGTPLAPLEKLPLLPTLGEWRTTTLTMVAKADQPVLIQLVNAGKPEDGKLSIQSLELIDLEK
jgi:eukaryotic-like serine/threonine-protein kinase